MGLEVGTYIDDLVATNPIGATDPRSQGDDHLRLIKNVLRNTFPRAAKSFSFPDYKLKTADYTILSSDENFLIGADATAAAVTLALPTLAAADAGWRVGVVALNLTNTLTVSGTINGGTNLVFGNVYEIAFFIWSGTAWYAFGGLRLSAAGVAQFGNITTGNIVASGDVTAVNATFSGLLDLSSVTDRMKLPKGTTAQRPGTPAAGDLRFNSDLDNLELRDSSGWREMSKMIPLPGIFRNLVIKVATNTTVAVTADSVSVTDGVTSQNIALNNTVNLGTTGANALDTGTIAAATWYYIWAIAKADGTVATLASLQSTNNATFLANLPSGYTFYARIGAVRTASGVAQLLGTWQFGRQARYIVGLAQTSTAQQMTSGASGDVSIPTWTAVSVSNFVPPTASMIAAMIHIHVGTATVMIAPNNSYGGNQSTTNPPPIMSRVPSSPGGMTSEIGNLLLESTNIYYACDGSTGALYCYGWEDNL